MAFLYAGCASQGARSYQEDAAAIRTGAGEEILVAEGHAGSAAELTLALADGKGGDAGGALASDIAGGQRFAAMTLWAICWHVRRARSVANAAMPLAAEHGRGTAWRCTPAAVVLGLL